MREVEALFAPHPVLVAPLQDDEVTGLSRLARHGAQIFGAHPPDALLSRAPRVRFVRDGADWRAVVPLPGADPARLDVAKVEDDLTITAGVRRRAIKLPRRVAGLELLDARLEDACLVVRFGRAEGAVG
jgi:HSP20 family molecular chaperone IbpA